jgi:hypothetical protein
MKAVIRHITELLRQKHGNGVLAALVRSLRLCQRAVDSAPYSAQYFSCNCALHLPCMQARKEELDTQVASERSALRKLEDGLHGAQTTAVALQARIAVKRSELDSDRGSRSTEQLAEKQQERTSVAAELKGAQKRHVVTRGKLSKAMAAADAAQENLAGLQAELVCVQGFCHIAILPAVPKTQTSY